MTAYTLMTLDPASTTAYPWAHRTLRALYAVRVLWRSTGRRVQDARVRRAFYLHDQQRRVQQTTQALLFRCALSGQFLRRLGAALRTLYHI